ncbi:MAG UNVERIFIED_CONTAM: transcription termination factor NusA [Rickettsiaceae bacterium]|jgi:N utilization substance protein A
MMNVGNSEILQIADAVGREKGIPAATIIIAMEQAIQVAGRRKYGHEHNIRAEINRKTGEVKLYRVLEIVEEVENSFTQIALKDALENDPENKLGGEILELLPPIDLGRVAAQTAKQVIVQKVKEAEYEKQYNEFKSRVGEIVSGIVKRVESGNVIVDLGRAEAVMRREDSIKTEIFKVNDRIKAYVKQVSREAKGHQISLSRADDQMLVKLFELEVPEIYEGNIKITAVARDPGSKAKVVVFANDSSLDPVGSCVGMKGSRIKAITNELNGEKIDVIPWSNDLAQFIINSLTPASISKVIIDEDKKRVEIIVPLDQLSIAIGRRGQNVRLASRITGWSIDILTEEQESKRRTDEFNTAASLMISALDVEEVMGQLLAAEGFNNIEQIATTDISVLANIEGFDENLAADLQKRAINYVEAKNADVIAKLETLGVEQELLDALMLSAENFLKLAEYGVKTLEDLGEISVQEFKALIPDSGMSDADIDNIIKAARTEEN